MATTPSPTEAAPLVREALAALEAVDFERYFALWSDDCRVELPMALPGIPEAIDGKPAVQAAERRAFQGIERREIRELEIRPLADPSFALAEFEMEQAFAAGGGLRARFCILFEAREGRLARMREYYDTRAIAEAMAAYDAAADAGDA